MLLDLIQSNKKLNAVHECNGNGLGGKFEAGETPEEGKPREVLEESGITISNPRLHGLLMFPNFKGNDWYVLVFMTGEFSGGLMNE